jgi:threonine 3-dehydrogenase
MQSNMLAVVKPKSAPGAEIREVKVPAFGARDVLVKVKVASICGTDLHIYNWDRWAQNRIHPPLIPGHEFCGEVAAFGDEVTSVKEGDFVSAEMHVACGKCLLCRTGEAHICQNVKIIGVDADGAFAEYVVIPESNIWKLDPAIPLDYASILDPLGNAVHTVLAGEIAAKTVAITGCGPIGLFAIAVARAVGATSVFAIEVNEHRRKIAHEMKADYVLDPSKEDAKTIVLEATGGLGVDVVLEMASTCNWCTRSPRRRPSKGCAWPGRKVRRPDRTIATVDHNVPTTIEGRLNIVDQIAAKQIATLRKNCADFRHRALRRELARAGHRARHRPGARASPSRA